MTVPPNTTAEVRVPTVDGPVTRTPHRARFLRTDGDHAVYHVPSGSYTFTTR
nr:hypothetical protein GCM10020092_069760 [Actinoplanes digitatis]